MKHFYAKCAVMAVVGLAACSKSGNNGSPAVKADKGNVEFVIRTAPRASQAPSSSQGFTPDEFRVLAFKKADVGEDYVYVENFNLSYPAMENGALKASVDLPAGDYKFIATYGLVTPGNYSWPELSNMPLSDDLCITHTEGCMPEVYMANCSLSEVAPYTVSLDGPPVTVNTQLRRAVSRVDVLFIRAQKDNNGNYKETVGDNVFGPEGLARADLDYADVNTSMGLTGTRVVPLSQTGLFNTTHSITNPADALVIGSADSTRLGKEEFKSYDDIRDADIISGSAHLRGTYLIPNGDSGATAGLILRLTSGKGTNRSIPIADKIPVERNKVTLIRIYVLGENVFTTGVDFGVEIDTTWDGVHTVDGEVD